MSNPEEAITVRGKRSAMYLGRRGQVLRQRRRAAERVRAGRCRQEGSTRAMVEA